MRGFVQDLKDCLPRGPEEREEFVWAASFVMVSGWLLGLAVASGRYGLLLGVTP